MSSTKLQPRFPLVQSLAALTAVLALMLGLACVALPLALGGRTPSHATALATAGVVWGTGVIGLVMVACLAGGGLMRTVAAYFVGMMVRLPVCFIFALWLNRGMGVPGFPLVVALAMFYLPALLLETALVGRYLWTSDALPPRAQAVPARPPAGSPEVTA